MLVEEQFFEHHHYYFKEEGRPTKVSDSFLNNLPEPIYFKGNVNSFDYCCFQVINQEPYTSYYIGIDWINSKQEKALSVQSKLNLGGQEQLDYVSMLFSLLNHPEVLQHVDQIYEIKWDSKPIEIPQEKDQLTPLLVVQFLQVLKQIVRKGLKKSYYKVERNLHGKVKGKVMVASTIKHNLLKNKPLNTYCSFDEFGVNGLENRLLKKALNFVQRYLNNQRINTSAKLSNLFNFINPAFADVSEKVSLHEVKHAKTNAFYKEYEQGIKLAKLILQKFGYNINNTSQTKVLTPPFWIDMSKLFELYVLGLLKDVYKSKVDYHVKSYWNELDYLLNDGQFQMVIDAKYKRYDQKNIEKTDIRQVSGYARLNSVYDKLNKNYCELIDCLIIYPDQQDGVETLDSIKLRDFPIDGYVSIYQLGVKLPILQVSRNEDK